MTTTTNRNNDLKGTVCLSFFISKTKRKRRKLVSRSVHSTVPDDTPTARAKNEVRGFYACWLKWARAMNISRMLTVPSLLTSALGSQFGELGLLLKISIMR